VRGLGGRLAAHEAAQDLRLARREPEGLDLGQRRRLLAALEEEDGRAALARQTAHDQGASSRTAMTT
jgi:hypothetical protein